MSDPLRLPSRCARLYEPERRLGSGAFGDVILARSRSGRGGAAVKVLHRVDDEGLEVYERFANEARITAALDHPNIVRVLDSGLDDEYPWIAYELLPGPDLAVTVRSGPMPWLEAAEAARQVAAALGRAHAEGVLHRDIKPANVLRAAPGHYKVCDFGIARWTGAERVRTRTGVVIGTPSYIAPEMVLGAPASERTDVYALAAMLHELLTGAALFADPNPLITLNHHVQTPPPRASSPLGTLPGGLVALVLRGLAKAPTERIASAGAFAADLEALCRGAQPRNDPARTTRPAAPPETEAMPVAPPAPRAVGRPSRAVPHAPAQTVVALEPRRSVAGVVPAVVAIVLLAAGFVAGRYTQQPGGNGPIEPGQETGASSPSVRPPVPAALVLEIDGLVAAAEQRARIANRASGRTRTGEAHPAGESWSDLAAAERAALLRLERLDREWPATAVADAAGLALRARLHTWLFDVSCRREAFSTYARIDARPRERTRDGEAFLFDQLESARLALSHELSRAQADELSRAFVSVVSALEEGSRQPSRLGVRAATLIEDVHHLGDLLALYTMWTADTGPRVAALEAGFIERVRKMGTGDGCLPLLAHAAYSVGRNSPAGDPTRVSAALAELVRVANLPSARVEALKLRLFAGARPRAEERPFRDTHGQPRSTRK